MEWMGLGAPGPGGICTQAFLAVMKSRGYQAWRGLEVQDLVQRMGRLVQGAKAPGLGLRNRRRFRGFHMISHDFT